MRTDRGLDRLVTFLDAVVAIAITLLVLPLIEVLPDVGRDQPLGDVLADGAEQFGAFLLSFVVIARLWLAHHRVTERIGAYDTELLLANFGWAFTVVVLPFTTQLVAVYGRDRLAVGLYVGTIAASSLFVSVLAVLVRRRPPLRRRGITTEELDPTPALVTSAVLLLALVLGVLLPGINYLALLLLLATGQLSGLVHRFRHRG